MASTKRPLIKGEFVWTISKKEGTFRPIFGPDPLEATDDDIFVIPDPEKPCEVIEVDNATDAIQRFITLNPDEYAVIHNPAESFEDGYPNGSYKSGRGQMKDLAYGKKRNVISGHFPVWPGQKVEVVKVHHLSASQYLMVEVESEQVDADAPYYDVTVECAKIKKAVVDETVFDKDADDSLKVSELATRDEDEPAEEKKETKKTDKKGSTKELPPAVVFRVGQRIVIPGSTRETYIPPTGITVVAERSITVSQDDELSQGVAKDIIYRRVRKGDIKIENIAQFFNKAGINDVFQDVQKQYERLLPDYRPYEALRHALDKILRPREVIKLASVFQQRSVPESSQEVVREAVVLGPTQFCVVVDEDGNEKHKQGPGRVFPGPYDRFRRQGSEHRVYNMYHLRSDRGILCRVVADEIDASDLQKQLPQAVVLEKKKYFKGDEIFISDVDAYLMPSNDFEVIDPETREPHIGNDHSQVFVQAIGVDQKSGVYVADVDTGSVDTEKGKVKLILDPRKQKHVHRKVPGREWNMWIAEHAPHKKVRDDAMVDTPWAISVVVPNNEAILINSRDSRRPVVGPCTELLAFDETLEVLRLSRGRPKTDVNQLPTCFLRTTGNFVTDQVTLETREFVEIVVDLKYGVQFVGEKDTERAKWFNVKDYVRFMCDNLRSRLRLQAKEKTLNDLLVDMNMAEFLRDAILGVKTEDQKHRPGLLFNENNMRVDEVEVLDIQYTDKEIATTLASTNSKIVTTQLEETAQRVILDHQKRVEEMEAEKAELELAKVKRDQEVQLVKAQSSHDIKRHEDGLNHAIALASEKLDHERKVQAHELSHERSAKQHEDAKILQAMANAVKELERVDREASEKLDLTLKSEWRNQAAEFKDKVSKIEADLVKALADAEATKIRAITEKLVEALEGHGNKAALAELAKHLPQATGAFGFITEAGGMKALTHLLKGTRFGKALEAINSPNGSLEAEAAREVEDGKREADRV